MLQAIKSCHFRLLTVFDHVVSSYKHGKVRRKAREAVVRKAVNRVVYKCDFTSFEKEASASDVVISLPASMSVESWISF